MSVLAFQLAAQRSGIDVGLGAVLAGVTSLTAGALGARRGRRLDERELGAGLRRACALSGAVMAALTTAVWFRAPFSVLLFFSIALGIAIAGVHGGFRAMLWVVAPDGDRARPQVLETMMTEVGFMIGPLLVVAIHATAGVTLVFALMTASWAAAAVVTRGLPALEPPPEAPRATLSGLWGVAVYAAIVAGSFSMIEASVPARVAAVGHGAGRAGLYLTLLSIGSCVGGLVAIARPPGRRGFTETGSRYALAIAVLAVPATLVSSELAFALTLPLSSVLLVPTMGLAATEADRRIGPTSRAQRFAAVMAIQMVGGGVGAIGAGAVITAYAPSTAALVGAILVASMGAVMVVTPPIARATAVLWPRQLAIASGDAAPKDDPDS